MEPRFIEAHDKDMHCIRDPACIEGDAADFFLQIAPQCHQPDARSVGSVTFVSVGGRQLAVKSFSRRGLVARVVKNHYAWRPYQRSRMWREFNFLAKLRALQLPVPRPAAALCHYHLPFAYSGKLATECIPGTTNLRDLLRTQPLPGELWTSIGQTIARFHHFNVYHADLNAANILIQQQTGQCFLVDFDKCKIQHDKAALAANITRLLRSLTKLHRQHPLNFDEKNWQAFLSGYHKQAALAMQNP